MAIPSCLLDTNVLLRISRQSDPEQRLVHHALDELSAQDTVFYYTHRNIAELWNVMTRPIARNGLGLSVAKAEQEVIAIERGMDLLPENEFVYREWRRLLLQYSISGVQVYDARLVAAMHVHEVRTILTLNVPDFQRFADINVMHPADV